MIVAVIVGVVLVGGWLADRPGISFGVVMWPMVLILGLLFFVAAHPDRRELLTAAGILTGVVIVSQVWRRP